ncbi:Pentatricopeptide repeat-containing protein [Glycine soja]
MVRAYPTVTERRRFAWSNKISIPNSSAVFHVRVLRLQFIHLFLSLKWWENVRVQNAEFRVPQHWAQVYLSRVQLHAVMMTVLKMLALTDSPLLIAKTFEATKIPTSTRGTVVCAAKGPRPRYPRVWKTHKKIGTISKAAKLVKSIKELSNVKEEVYGALDSYVAWELEFPLITVKKALKTLEFEQDWKRITKWMLSKGQGKTMGSYFTLLNALVEDDRLDEAEELWTKLLMQYMESLPRRFFDKMISIYHKRGMHDKMFEIFADMEELCLRPNIVVVSMIGDAFKERGMLDKYQKLHAKYPPPQWEYRYIRGKRVKVKVEVQSSQVNTYIERHGNVEPNSDLNKDYRSSEKTSETVDQQLRQDADVISMEPERISDINNNYRSEETSDMIDDQQLGQEADVISMELEQISDDSYDSMEPILDV